MLQLANAEPRSSGHSDRSGEWTGVDGRLHCSYCCCCGKEFCAGGSLFRLLHQAKGVNVSWVRPPAQKLRQTRNTNCVRTWANLTLSTQGKAA
eukprot:6453166-Amphidinium_carterae.2